jgi:hypothetical protein
VPNGFDGMTKEMINEELFIYVSEKLADLGKDTEVTEKIIIDNVPAFSLRTKNSRTATEKFPKVVKDVKPQSEGTYISVAEWWGMINVVCSDYGWSVATRVRFLGRTGGLAAKVNENHKDRV